MTTTSPRFRTAAAALPVLAALAGALSAAEPVEEKIREIRSLYNTIESAQLTSRKVEFEGQDEPIVASCTTYMRGEEVVKVHLSHGGDHFASDEYFYYRGGELAFVYATDGSWRFTGETLPNGEGETIDGVVEHRVYVEGGAILRHLTKEASSKKADEVGALLAKAENRPGTDAERAASLVARGKSAAGIRTGADVGKVLFPGQ